jgi:MFS family permease
MTANSNFRLLWSGQLITQIGSEMSLLAIPILATILLNASAMEMGILIALEWTPPIFLAIFVGVYADRYRPKTLMIISDLARFVLLLALGLLAFFHQLPFKLLCILAVLVSCFRIAFDIASNSFLPSILPREELVSGNGRLGVARSFSDLSGPPLAGLLIQVLTAPVVILVDALSFLFSAALLGLIKEKYQGSALSKGSVWPEIVEGARAVLSNKLRMSMLCIGAIWNFFYSGIMSVFVIYALKILGLSVFAFGFTYLPGGVGVFVGSFLFPRMVKRFGLGLSAVSGIITTSLWGLLLVVSKSESVAPMPVLMLAIFCFGLGQSLYNNSSASINQLITGAEVLGRVSGFSRLIGGSMIPLGAIIGGYAGKRLGIPTAIALGAGGIFLTAIGLACTPLIRLRSDSCSTLVTV